MTGTTVRLIGAQKCESIRIPYGELCFVIHKYGSVAASNVAIGLYHDGHQLTWHMGLLKDCRNGSICEDDVIWLGQTSFRLGALGTAKAREFLGLPLRSAP